jgi:hypothetical protein
LTKELKIFNVFLEDKMGNKGIHIILVFVSFLLFIVSMQIMRHYANNVMEYNNEKILDLRFGYSYDDVKYYINGLNNNGKNYYIKKLHLFDTFYPIIYGTFYILALSYFIRNSLPKNRIIKLILLIPIIGIICDYCENILINSFVKNIDNVLNNICKLSSYFTKIKFIAIYLSLLLVIILLIYSICKKIYKKRQTSA